MAKKRRPALSQARIAGLRIAAPALSFLRSYRLLIRASANPDCKTPTSPHPLLQYWSNGVMHLKAILQHSRTPTIHSSRLRHSYPIAVTMGVAAACLDGPYPAITQRMTDATTHKRATS